MGWNEVFGQLGCTIASRHELISSGASGRSLTTAVAGGYLIRVRRDHYALPDTVPILQQCVRVGGRMACVSTLAHLGVFAFDSSRPHLHLKRQASRSRSPHNRRVPLNTSNRSGVTLHWSQLLDAHDGDETSVGIQDALAQAIVCQEPWHAIASLDNALHLGLVDEADLAEIFSLIPLRLQYLKGLVDGRSEAGQESVLRMLLHAAGLRYEVQVEVPGVGRVDLLVEGVLVLEADSRLAHDGWEHHVVDRWRDVQLARRSLMSLRPAYQHTMNHPTEVIEAVFGLLVVAGIDVNRR